MTILRGGDLISIPTIKQLKREDRMQKENTFHAKYRAPSLFFGWGIAHTSAVNFPCLRFSKTPGWLRPCWVLLGGQVHSVSAATLGSGCRRRKRKLREIKRLIQGFPATPSYPGHFGLPMRRCSELVSLIILDRNGLSKASGQPGGQTRVEVQLCYPDGRASSAGLWKMGLNGAPRTPGPLLA